VDADTQQAVVGFKGKFPANTVDAICQQYAQGVPISAVARYFGTTPTRITTLLEDNAAVVDHYRSRFQFQAMLNVSQVYLAAPTIIGNLIAEASSRDNKQWLESAKLLSPHILPTRPESEVTVKHQIDAQVAVQLTGLLGGLLKVTKDLPADVDTTHIVDGSLGVPKYNPGDSDS
jgi:hypothetical protein